MTEKIIDFTDPDIYVDRVEEFTDALYDPNIRYIFLKWWAWAWKSYLVAQIMVQNILDWIRLGVFRKVSNTLRASCLQLFKDICSSWDLTNNEIEIKESKEVKAINSNGFAMMFWLDDPEKIKSLANFDRFRVEEATELTYDDFTQLDLRLRWSTNHKMILSFNPISSRHWLKLSVFDHNRRDAIRIMKTARDNKFVGERYLQTLESMKEKNYQKYLVYAKNQRGETVEWMVYENYTTFTTAIDPEVIGLDFWRNDPCSLIYLKREDVPLSTKKRLYAQEMLYIRELDSTALIKQMHLIGVPKNVLIIADSSRPEMINAISLAWYMIVWVKKYMGSVNDQITHVQWYDLYLLWDNITRECAWYMWKKDKNWNTLDVPVDWDDHTLDALRYWATHFYNSNEVIIIG